MTPEQAKKLLDDPNIAPLFRAFADAKQMQWNNQVTGWRDITYLDPVNFTLQSDCIRIKPEPEECWVVKYSNGVRSFFRSEEAAKEILGPQPKGATLHHLKEVL